MHEKTRKFVATALILTLFGCATAVKITEYPFDERPLAAIMPFAYTANLPEHASSVSGMADALAASLLKTGRIRLLERQRIDSVLTEMKLASTGVIDSKTAAAIGKQLGARMVVLGSVTSVSVREEGRSVKIAEKTDRWVDVEAEARLVDIETGELLASGKTINSAHSAEKHAFGGKVGQLATPEALVQKALQGLGDKLAEDLARNIRPVKK